jgi:glutathione synthase/RimK-type ligase-like ATP-grasp enzyme
VRGVDPDDWDARPDHGRIRGLRDGFGGLGDVLASFPVDARYMNPPSTVLAMFDKMETKRRLRAAGLTTPTTHALVRTFDELEEALHAAKASRVFVKPRHGSSASGVIALSRSATRILATTSIELDDDRLYNSLKIRRYRRPEEVRTIVDLLGREDELLVEEWIPKDSAQRGTYDLRIVCIDGSPGHSVMRLSQHPMTNLHLGNARGDLAALRTRLGPSTWHRLQEIARRSAAAFDALYAGIDIAITPGGGHVVVFEVNAFGDLLPGVLDASGRTTYEAEIDALLQSR